MRLQITNALVAAILVVALRTGQTRADVIFDNLNNGIFSSGSYYYSNKYSDINPQTAQDFPLTADYRLDAITIPLATLATLPNVATIQFYGSTQGLPGPILESWTVLGQMHQTGPGLWNDVTVLSVLHPLLTAGGQYFVSVHAPDPGQIIYSPGSSILTSATQAESDDQGQTWFLRFQGTNVGFMAFRVEGTNIDVPEPSALALTIVAALPFAALVRQSIGRRRSRGLAKGDGLVGQSARPESNDGLPVGWRASV
jgi:hypothetical protein